MRTVRLKPWRPEPEEDTRIRAEIAAGKTWDWDAEFATLLKGAKLRLRNTRLEKESGTPTGHYDYGYALDFICPKDRDRSDATIYGGSIPDLVALAHAFMSSQENFLQARVGEQFSMTINQGTRYCTIVKIGRNRARIEYEMPNAGTMGGYVPVVRLGWRVIVVPLLYRTMVERTSPIDGKTRKFLAAHLMNLGN